LAGSAGAPLLRTTEEALRLLERLDDPALELVVASLHDLRRSSRGETGTSPGVVIPLFGEARRAR
jgi:hypothetical protein